MGSEGSGEQGAGAGRDGANRDGANRESGRASSDPLGDFQRWLMKAGARSIGREVADRVRSTVSGGKRSSGDVWDTATTEPPPEEAPECAWCPICRAARRYRDSGGTSGGGLGSQIAGVSDTLAGLAQDAFSIFEQALRSQQRPPSRPGGTSPGGTRTGSNPPAGAAPTNAAASPASPSPASPAPVTDPWAGAISDTGTGWPASAEPPAESLGAPPAAASPAAEPSAASAELSESPGFPQPSDDGPVVGAAPVLGGTAVHPQDQDGEAANEGGDREERGEAGDGPASGLGDDQVEGTAD